MKKRFRPEKTKFKHDFRYKLYRLQQHVAITSREARALWALLSFLLLGMIVGEIRKHRPAFSPEIYAEIDSLFYQATTSQKAQVPQSPGDTPQGADTSKYLASDSLIAFFKPVFPININTATVKELERLPRIGPKMAERIVDFRQKNGTFKNKGDLMRVRGIGEKTFEQLADKITVD